MYFVKFFKSAKIENSKNLVSRIEVEETSQPTTNDSEIFYLWHHNHEYYFIYITICLHFLKLCRLLMKNIAFQKKN